MDTVDLNVVDIGMRDYLQLDEITKMRLKVRAGDSAGIADAAQLEDAVYRFVHMGSLENTPYRFATINRRFGRALAKFGISTSVLVDRLVAKGLVLVMRNKTSATLVAAASVVGERKDWHMSEGATPAELFAAEERFWSNAE